MGDDDPMPSIQNLKYAGIVNPQDKNIITLLNNVNEKLKNEIILYIEEMIQFIDNLELDSSAAARILVIWLEK